VDDQARTRNFYLREFHKTEEDQEEAVFREVVSFTPDPLPVRYYDKDTTKPISFYLSSLEELLAWTPDVEDSFNVALGPPECRQPPLSSRRPRTLMCHDMMGGFIQGSAAQSPYSFYHWQYIDIFVYFSHHTVTIPPVGWTNAAHRHGVCVLGTFITEWKEGERLCEAFLAGDERSYRAVAHQLVLIAQFFRFDGWLINIENSLSLAAVGNMPHFLRYLTTQLHQQVPRGLVLWYDSVVSSGQLTWQDELNEHNRFWSLLERYLPTHSICSLPFVTSFCLGMGTRRVCYGQEEAVGPWYHLSAQEIQPLFGEHRLQGDGRGWVKMHCCLADAWNGGSSLVIRGLIPPEVGNVSVRLFSLQVPVPPKIFLSMVYKLEGPSAVGVALELTTGDAGSCHVGGISALSAETSSRRSPRPLRVPPTKLAKWVGRCGQQLSGGWVQSCYEVNLRGCLLQALFVNFSRPPGSQEEENFICRLGEIQVVDASSLLSPLPQVQAVTVSQVHWQPATSEGESGAAGLRLSCTLHWAYLLPHVRCFRIHCCQGSGEPGRDGRVEFLVEPIPKEGFLVPRAEWGRAAMLYSTPRTFRVQFTVPLSQSHLWSIPIGPVSCFVSSGS
ncbi:hypothetical protein E2I00_001448, partial [Balaenoptera physalus]